MVWAYMTKNLPESVEISQTPLKNNEFVPQCNQCSMFDDGPDVDEEALIEGKTEYEKTYILKHRSIFSESLNPDRFIKAPPM